MVVVSYSGKEINAKLVYYGAGLSGKTTNLEAIYEAVPETSRGKMVSMKTQSDRTLFFDLLPLELGEILGFKTRFLLYTVPGQVFYNATRKLVLKGADAIVFVADSEVGKMEENKDSLANLRANLAEYKVDLDDLPWVIQYNKRDLPSVYSMEELNGVLNPEGKIPSFEAVATQGKGVFETFRAVSHLIMEKVTSDLRRASSGGAARHRGVSIEETSPGTVRPSPPAQPTPLPVGQSMAREALQASPAKKGGNDPVGGIDYGREIELSSEIPPKAASHEAPPAARSAEAKPAERPVNVARDSQAALEALRRTVDPTPVAAQATAAAKSPAPVARDSRSIPVPVPRTQAQVAAEPRAETVVPIRLKPGESLREINIRIVVTGE